MIERFETVYDQKFSVQKDVATPDLSIIKDRETGVLYLCSFIGGVGVALTPLLDQNGKPTVDK